MDESHTIPHQSRHGTERRLNAWAIGAAVFLVVFAVFLPALRNGFVNYDDPTYVTENFHVQRGLSWEGVRWAFCTGYAANWHPLHVDESHARQSGLWLKPWGHHLTSVLLHAFNAALLVGLLRRLTGATGRSLFAALLFGLHPLRVESVAWIAERKDVLSGAFWLLTIWSYAEWVRRVAAKERGAWIHLTASLLFFALGLMSKPSVVTLPFVLFLLDYWPLARFDAGPLSKGRRTLVLILEKAPYFLLALMASIITFLVQRSGGAMKGAAMFSFSSRAGNALVSYDRYLGKLFYPDNLAAFYPYVGSWPIPIILLCGLVVLVISVLAFRERNSRPWLFAGWFWYVGTLVPMIGLIQVGTQAMADRYTYLPMIGLSIVIAWGATEVLERARFSAFAERIAAALAVVLCVVLTVHQIGYWNSSETLFRHALAVTDGNGTAQLNLGIALWEKGAHAEAIREVREAVALAPDYADSRVNLGTMLAQNGQIYRGHRGIKGSWTPRRQHHRRRILTWALPWANNSDGTRRSHRISGSLIRLRP